MSLMQWLTVGRSFSDAQEKPTRYKMTSLNLLPKFGTENRKLGGQGSGPLKVDEAVDRPNSAMDPLHYKPLPPDDTVMNSSSLAEKATVSSEEPTRAHQASLDLTSKATRRYPNGRWHLIGNPWSRPAKQAAVKESRQGELTLEQVQPVRNHLCDSDLEFVLRAPESPAPSPNAEPSIRGRSGFLKRLGSKLLRKKPL